MIMSDTEQLLSCPPLPRDAAPGTAVLVVRDKGTIDHTTTRSEVFEHNGDEVVRLGGIPGFYLASRVYVDKLVARSPHLSHEDIGIIKALDAFLVSISGTVRPWQSVILNKALELFTRIYDENGRRRTAFPEV